MDFVWPQGLRVVGQTVSYMSTNLHGSCSRAYGTPLIASVTCLTKGDKAHEDFPARLRSLTLKACYLVWEPDMLLASESTRWKVCKEPRAVQSHGKDTLQSMALDIGFSWWKHNAAVFWYDYYRLLRMEKTLEGDSLPISSYQKLYFDAVLLRRSETRERWSGNGDRNLY